MKKKPWVRFRHKIWYGITYIPMRIFLKTKFHFKCKKIKYDKKQRYFIISNHQTDIDPVMLYVVLGRTVYPLTTDTLFSSKFGGAFLSHTFAPIPKRKGVADQKAIKTLLQVVKEGGDVMVFPEGNRTYAEFQYPIEESISKLIKKCKLPLMILNIHGGTGVSPRYGIKSRKGQTYVELKKIVSKEELANYSDKELLDLMKNELRVYDSESGKEFKSNYNAEYMECMLFVCPKCGKTGSLRSDGNYLSCSCGLKVEYTSNLRFKSDDEEFKFNYLNDWYQYQKKWAREVDIKPDEIIFQDDNVSLFVSHLNENRKLVTTGKLTLTDKYLNFNDVVKIPLSELEMASPISGRKFNFNTKDETFLVTGTDRFNPLKYVFMFNRLETKMKGHDIYYNIYD